MYNIPVKITRNDIKNGKKLDAEKCPIAIAVNKVLKSSYYTSVNLSAIYIFDKKSDGGRAAARFESEGLQTFVYSFDLSFVPSPTTLTFRVKNKDAEKYFKKSALNKAK